MGNKSLQAQTKKQKPISQNPVSHLQSKFKKPALQAFYSAGLTSGGNQQIKGAILGKVHNQIHPFLETIMEDSTATSVNPAQLDSKTLQERDAIFDQKEARMKQQYDDSAALTHTPQPDPLYSAPPSLPILGGTRRVKPKAQIRTANIPKIVKPELDSQGYPRRPKK